VRIQIVNPGGQFMHCRRADIEPDTQGDLVVEWY